MNRRPINPTQAYNKAVESLEKNAELIEKIMVMARELIQLSRQSEKDSYFDHGAALEAIEPVVKVSPKLTGRY